MYVVDPVVMDHNDANRRLSRNNKIELKSVSVLSSVGGRVKVAANDVYLIPSQSPRKCYSEYLV